MIATRSALGRAGIEVSTVGFVGAPLGALYACLDELTAIATVELAIASGVNLIGTSPLWSRTVVAPGWCRPSPRSR